MNFCTIFDSGYFSRGLLLYESLIKHTQNFHLYVFAFDDRTETVLNQMQLDKVTIISLNDFEDNELLSIKMNRTMTEYCWSSTPSALLYCLRNFHLNQCTYLDADIYFFASPQILLDEYRDQSKSILITEHRYSRGYDQSKRSGKYCVQFVSFKNNYDGLKALSWWREKCLEWCFAKIEDGKFGNQKYLDDWPTRFNGVHVLEHLGGGIAPWNVQQYRFEDQDGKLIAIHKKDQNKPYPVVFFHFHALKTLPDKLIELGLYTISLSARQFIYRTYLRHMIELGQRLTKLDSYFGLPDVKNKARKSWKAPFKFIKRQIFRSYNIYRLAELIK